MILHLKFLLSGGDFGFRTKLIFVLWKDQGGTKAIGFRTGSLRELFLLTYSIS